MVVDVNSPIVPLDVAFLPVDVALNALLDDSVTASSLVRDEDVDLEALDARAHSSFVDVLR